MNVYKAFPSKWLSGSELKGAVVVTIANVKEEKISRPGVGEVTDFVMYVEHGTKGVILGMTLARQIAAAIGEEEMDNWGGHQVILYGVPMIVGGVPRVAIRARAVENNVKE